MANRLPTPPHPTPPHPTPPHPTPPHPYPHPTHTDHNLPRTLSTFAAPPRRLRRMFLSPYDLTPTHRAVHNKFSVRYFLNLVLVDEEDRRYFKQQVAWVRGVGCFKQQVAWVRGVGSRGGLRCTSLLPPSLKHAHAHTSPSTAPAPSSRVSAGDHDVPPCRR